MRDLLSSLLAIVAIALAAFGVGRPLLRKLAIAEDDLFSTVVWGLSLGLVAAGWLFSWLALAGCLSVPVVLVFTIAGGFWGLGEIFCCWLEWRAGAVVDLLADFRRAQAGPPMPPGTALALGILACLAAAGALVSALAPPDSPEALTHCLELSKTFLLSHGVAPLPYNDYAPGPLLTEMWYAWALALDGPVAAGLLQWMFGALLAAAAVLLARPLVGRRAAPVCGALVLLTPGVSYQMGAPLDDLALALFTSLLLTAWWQGAICARGNRWLIAAGIMAGAAAGTKLVGLVFATAVLAVSIAVRRQRLESWQVARRMAVHALCPAVLVGGIGYLWAAWHGGPIAAEESCPGAMQQIGALLIAALPGLLLVRRAEALKPFFCVALVYGAVTAACFANLRCWAPLVPLLSVAATLVWREVVAGQGFARRLAQFGLLLLAVWSAAIPLARARGQFAVAIGWQSREDYLVRHQAIYPAALLANQIMRPGDCLLSQDPHTFYFSYPATDARAYHRCVGSLASTGGESISQQLRSAGFTHVLLAEPALQSPFGSENDLGERIGREIEQSGQTSVLPLAEYQWSDASSTARRYRLVKLR